MVWKPPIIPERIPGWERVYVDIMTRFQETPFSWDQEDHCLATPSKLCLGMTGVDPMAGVGSHTSETSALKILTKLGFSTVEDALEAVFPEISVLTARRGDCGIVDQVVDGRRWPATFIVMGDRSIGKSLRGIIVVPTGRLKRTFAIGKP